MSGIVPPHPCTIYGMRSDTFISVALDNGKYKVAHGLNSTPLHEIVLGGGGINARFHSNSQLCECELATLHGRFTPGDRCSKMLDRPPS
jgi:hypothetical protein